VKKVAYDAEDHSYVVYSNNRNIQPTCHKQHIFVYQCKPIKQTATAAHSHLTSILASIWTYLKYLVPLGLTVIDAAATGLLVVWWVISYWKLYLQNQL